MAHFNAILLFLVMFTYLSDSTVTYSVSPSATNTFFVGTVVNSPAGDGRSWSWLTNIIGASNQYAVTSSSLSSGSNANSRRIVLSTWNYQLRRPPSECSTVNPLCRITGIQVAANVRLSNSNAVHSITMRLVKGTEFTSEKEDTYSTTNQVTLLFPSVTNDLWGTNWTEPEINAMSIDWFHSKVSGNNVNARVYWARLLVHYTITTDIESVSPASTNSLAGGVITIRGTFFHNLGNARCRIGSNLTAATIVNSTTITCPIPQQNEYGTYSVAVSLDGVTFTNNAITFQYICDTSIICNGNGICLNNGSCECNNGWKGSNCETPNCASLNECNNGNGTCIPGPACSCNSQYTGDQCDIPRCTALNECSGNGNCIRPNECSCLEGWASANCSVPDCSGRNGCNSANGGGVCVSPNNCSCNDNFNEPNCYSTCTPSCGTNQFCALPNVCACEPGWKPPDCLVQFDCLTISNCSGHGTCIGEQQCQCSPGWKGDDCATPDCDALNNCHGHGTCVGPFLCECASGWTNGDCNTPSCEANAHCNFANGGGFCSAPNTCVCIGGWQPPNCTLPSCSNCGENEFCQRPELCACKPGFIPPLCIPEPISCTSLNDCNGRGSCTATNVCQCSFGWSQPDCFFPDCSGVRNCTSEDNGYCAGPQTCFCFGDFTGADCSGIGFIEDETPKQETGNYIIGIAAAAAAAGLLAIVFVAFILILRRRKLRKIERLIFKEPDYNLIVYGKFLSLQYSGVKDAKNLQPLVALLLKPEHKLALAVANITPVTEKDNVAKALVYFFTAHQQLIPILCSLINIELEQCKGENTLFRSNSFPIALFQTFSKITGIRYLWDALGPFLQELNVISKDASKNKGESSLPRVSSQLSLMNSDLNIEIDPSKVEDGSSMTINKYTLLLTTQKLFHCIVQPDKVPKAIRAVMYHVSNSIQKTFPTYRYKAIGSFMFLRFVVPAISAPHVYGLYEDPPDDSTQRKLVLLSKVLQNLANEVQFGNKEAHMATLNDFIRENQEDLHQFFDKISAPVTESTNDLEQQYSIPETVVNNAILYLHNYCHQHMNKIASELETVDDALSREFRSTIQQLGDPAPLKRD